MRNKICPQCGGPMDYRASVCKDCHTVGNAFRQFNGDDWLAKAMNLGDSWLDQFIGLFLGEGSVFFSLAGKNRTPALVLAIALRSDDALMLQEIHAKLGGKFYFDHAVRQRNPNAGDRALWILRGLPIVREACRLILSRCHLPAKKLDEVRLAVEFADWRLSIGMHMTEKQRQTAKSYIDRMRAIRAFKVPSE